MNRPGTDISLYLPTSLSQARRGISGGRIDAGLRRRTVSGWIEPEDNPFIH
jgi:hypothetical protein